MVPKSEVPLDAQIKDHIKSIPNFELGISRHFWVSSFDLDFFFRDRERERLS